MWIDERMQAGEGITDHEFMRNVHVTNAASDGSTLDAYASALARNGTSVLPGLPGTFWVRYESYAMMRMPTFVVTTPSREELQRLFRRGRTVVVSYLAVPDEDHVANAWLYRCTDRTYSLDTLAPAMRRNVRRASKEFGFDVLTPDQVLTHGLAAYCDTRRRVGLSDGTADCFHRRFGSRARCPGHVYVGAWRGNQLAAFLSIIKVDTWAEIEGCFSQDALLNARPNDFLMYSVLSRYLTDEKLQLVSYGLSSIQQTDNLQGLHAFKTKVGFQAQPVHRVFSLHPLLRPFANRLALRGLNLMGNLWPGNRFVKKAGGMLASLLGNERQFVSSLQTPQ